METISYISALENSQSVALDVRTRPSCRSSIQEEFFKYVDLTYTTLDAKTRNLRHENDRSDAFVFLFASIISSCKEQAHAKDLDKKILTRRFFWIGDMRPQDSCGENWAHPNKATGRRASLFVRVLRAICEKQAPRFQWGDLVRSA